MGSPTERLSEREDSRLRVCSHPPMLEVPLGELLNEPGVHLGWSELRRKFPSSLEPSNLLLSAVEIR